MQICATTAMISFAVLSNQLYQKAIQEKEEKQYKEINKMDNYNEVIGQMLDNGKTPEAIYEDVLAIVKERNNKKVREMRESAIKTLDEALVTFFETIGDMTDDEVKDMSGFYLNSIVDTADASRKRKNKSSSKTSSTENKSSSKTSSTDPWLMRLFGLED